MARMATHGLSTSATFIFLALLAPLLLQNHVAQAAPEHPGSSLSGAPPLESKEPPHSVAPVLCLSLSYTSPAPARVS